jgi:hypothetical protein
MPKTTSRANAEAFLQGINRSASSDSSPEMPAT